jgi:putative acetyltransferase
MEITARPATNQDVEAIKQLVFGVLREYGLEPDPDGTDADLADIEANYAKRGGLFELLEDENGKLLGTVGLYPINAETVELRKMYFAPELRGRGCGKTTLERMIKRARELGFQKMYLETNSVLKEAIGLYQKFGFEPTNEKHSPRCDQAFVLNL